MGNTPTPPLVVKMTRVNDCREIGPEEHYFGILVNEAGEPIESPCVGSPIFLGGNDLRPWLLRTDLIYELDVCDEQWIAVTSTGITYIIENQRLVH